MAADRRKDALFAARLHVKQGTLLSDKAVRDVCAELLLADEAESHLARDNDYLRARVVVRSYPKDGE